MTSRREFLKGGLAASALPLTLQVEPGSAAPTPTVSLYKVLYDTRFPASVAFARRAEEHGLVVQATAGDVTRFWYDDLYPRWQKGPAAIAGLTAHGALFCLERLAWDQRLRVVFRGEHAPAANGCVAHRFEGPAASLSTVVAAAGEVDWAAAVADVVADCPRGRMARRVVSARTMDAATMATETLYSWVIAPVTRA